MLNRIRNFGTNLAGGVNWIRMIYLANWLTALVVMVFYVFGIRLYPIGGLALPESVLLILAYLICLLLCFILERLQIYTTVAFFDGLYRNQGLRWLDMALLILAPASLFLAYWAGFFNLAFIICTILVFINSFLSLWQLRSPYGMYPGQTDPQDELLMTEPGAQPDERQVTQNNARQQ
jgi:hypothetical protein